MRRIRRKCVVCGKAMGIKVKDSGRYDNGHYFGKMKIPIEGTGKYVEIGKSKIFGTKAGVVSWTGKEKEVEYWEHQGLTLLSGQ
jgi:hypothetical protein